MVKKQNYANNNELFIANNLIFDNIALLDEIFGAMK
jgi:hypothetical protein